MWEPFMHERAEGRERGAKNTTVEFDNGPVCGGDVVPCRIGGVGGFLESRDADEGYGACAGIISIF